MKIVLDENVPVAVAERLREMGHDVTCMAEQDRGLRDEEVWQLATEGPALLVTRDHHFADPSRFDTALTLGVIYLRRGNLRVADELRLIEAFLQRHSPEEYASRLVTLSPGELRIR